MPTTVELDSVVILNHILSRAGTSKLCKCIHFRVSKSVTKRLTKKGELKGNDDLTHWIKSISNHLWWCYSSCNKNADELVEKWKSVLNHISNKHRWRGNMYFHKCYHRRLSRREEKQKMWLSPTSQAYIAAEKVVCDRRLHKDIRKLTEFCHTGELEVCTEILSKARAFFIQWNGSPHPVSCIRPQQQCQP